MTLRFQTWRLYTRLAAVLSIPASAILFFEPGRTLEVAAFIFVSTVGLSGALVAILFFTGVLHFIFTDSDRCSFEYRLLQSRGVTLGKRGADDDAA